MKASDAYPKRFPLPLTPDHIDPILANVGLSRLFADEITRALLVPPVIEARWNWKDDPQEHFFSRKEEPE